MPTPSQIAKSGSEHAEQSALFAWCAVALLYGFAAADDDKCYQQAGYAAATYSDAARVQALKWFHAIPNGGSRGDDDKSRAIRGGQLKAEGQKNGVPDTFLPVPRNGWHGLYIEMKRAKGGTVSPEQKEFGAFAHEQGYGWIVCHGWREAANVLKEYLK